MNTVNEQEFREYVDAAFKKHIECKRISHSSSLRLLG
ncbi:TPA_asm: hypothetical protein [Porphyromonas phage phage025a_SJD11]|uniref:Uncharacterized protein n=1 Tax=Porphyromonas phage phage025a_SJD11 TaxID=3154115 RepID=A0AAT9JD92_9CAUD